MMNISLFLKAPVAVSTHVRGGAFSTLTLLLGALAVISSLTSTAICAEEANPAEPAATIDVSALPATVVDDVIVPVPSEVFTVLDKLGSPDWRRELPEKAPTGTPGSRPRIALFLGLVIADGFIAVQAQDSERVKDAGREVLRLAGAIGVRESVVRRSKSIIDAAEQKSWSSVRSELDKALQDVRNAMIELNDLELAQLVSLGGWLRGTAALGSIVSRDYRAETAELLYQPMLVQFFTERLANAPAAHREEEVVVAIAKGLAEIAPLVAQGDASTISKDAVERIRNVAAELVTAISATE